MEVPMRPELLNGLPDAGPVFTVALAGHVAAGLTAVVSGALAATAAKRPGRHPRAGRVYLWALAGVAATAAVLAAIRWHHDAHLLGIAVTAAGLASYGFQARRHPTRGWPVRHAVGMGGSYIALLTGFYVDNGPFLPLWSRLPHLTYWLLPTLVGAPLIRLGIRRFTRARHPASPDAGCRHPASPAE